MTRNQSSDQKRKIHKNYKQKYDFWTDYKESMVLTFRIYRDYEISDYKDVTNGHS